MTPFIFKMTRSMWRKLNKEGAEVLRANAEDARSRRAAARAAKKATKAQGLDVYGSNARRAMQVERDAKLIAQPVAATPAGTGRLNLRPIEEVLGRQAGDGNGMSAARHRRRARKRHGRPKQFISPANRRRSAR